MFQGTSEMWCQELDSWYDWARGPGEECGFRGNYGAGWLNYHTILIYDDYWLGERYLALMSFGKF